MKLLTINVHAWLEENQMEKIDILAKDIADKFSVDRRRVAGLLDIFSSAFQGLMPYAGQILVAAAMAQISPVSIVPYSWYSMFMIVMGILAIITGIPKLKEKN